jgi:dephospho-CoA kinase
VIAQQATRAARLAIADAVVYNDGISLDELAAEVRQLWQGWAARLA